MASKAREGDGWRVQWFDASGKRQSIRTGKMSETNADGIRRRIEGLLAAKASGEPMARSLAEWVSDLSDKAHAKLAARGLLESRESRRAWTLGELLTRYFDCLAVKAGTRATYEQTRAMLMEHFGERRALASITPLDAEGWVSALRESGLAVATQSKRLKDAKAMFAKGVRWGMLASSVFADFKAGAQHNDERTVFIPREVVERVLASCPDAEWRAIVALGRYGGLRCPSETLSLRWQDIDWDAGRMRVRSTKTEGTEGRGHRFTPLFPELRSILLDAYEAADDGAEFVVQRYRSDTANLRTQLRRILERAGVEPWPRLLHAMRASRVSELHAAYPAKDAAAWLGHGIGVALRHYASAQDATFAAAAATPTGPMPERNGAKNGARAVQKAAHPGGAAKCRAVKPEAQTVGACTDTHQKKTPCTIVQGEGMTPAGFMDSFSRWFCAV
jgi:integrase